MGAPVTIKEVAARAEVSVGTVSNVLNRPDQVAAPTRARVEAAIAELGFVRNESARQLRAGHSRTVGLVVLDVANPFFTDVARGAEDALNDAGLAVLLCNSDEQDGREARYLELLEQQRVQGILITPVHAADQRLAAIRRRGTPVVLVDRLSRSRGQCSVAVDDVLGGDLAASHLFDGGHDRIAYVGGPFTIRQVQDRYDGALRAMAQRDRDPADLHVVETPTLNIASGQRAGELLAELPARRRPTAAFCANDMLALGLLQALTRRRVAVPADMAIVGYDDIDFAAAATVPLSSVRQPRQQLGQTAAELLLEEALQGGRHKHRQVVFDPELVVRDSSGARRRAGRSRPAAVPAQTAER